LVAECHLVEHIISATLQDNFLRIEMSTLIRNMIGIDESLNAYSEEGARPCRVAPQGMIGDSRIYLVMPTPCDSMTPILKGDSSW